MVDAPFAIDPSHDPGTAAARLRGDELFEAPVAPTHLHFGECDVRIGTASWTDPSLTAPGVFYPDRVRTPEQRLKFYSSRFAVVEVDSSFYALPSRRNAELWVERTPDDFAFDVKAFALMTGHATDTERLPAGFRAMLPPEIAALRRIYAKDLSPELRDEVWRLFADAVQPLWEADKLGAVFLQYPKWVRPAAHSAEMLGRARERLGSLPIAVEFRHRDWLLPANRGRTLAMLRDLGMTYVTVDAPQGLESSVPGDPIVTDPSLAVVRLHGRRVDQWERPNAPVLERYRYLYDREELLPWAAKVREIADRAERLHVVFNNCYANYGTTNAIEMAGMLAAMRLD